MFKMIKYLYNCKEGVHIVTRSPNIRLFLTNEEEGQYLDRKSARIKPIDIARRHIVAFANANGGVLVIGIEDDGQITGFHNNDSKSINDFLEIPYSFL